MRSVITVVPLCVCVCVLDTTVSRAKTAEPIAMPFGVWTWMGPRNHILCGGLDPPVQWVVFWGGISRPVVKYREYLM